MSLQTEVIIALCLIVSAPLLIFFRWKMPYRLNVRKFMGEWKDLQDLCRDRSTWCQAIIDADKLLEQALKKRKYKGKSMGERLVAAQRVFSNNDSIWSAHNLCKKVVASPKARPSEAVVKSALIAYRQALKDIGALPNGQSRKA